MISLTILVVVFLPTYHSAHQPLPHRQADQRHHPRHARSPTRLCPSTAPSIITTPNRHRLALPNDGRKIRPPTIGQIIFDPNGEYAWPPRRSQDTLPPPALRRCVDYEMG
jgi:hypothetical protein